MKRMVFKVVVAVQDDHFDRATHAATKIFESDVAEIIQAAIWKRANPEREDVGILAVREVSPLPT